MDPEKRLFVDRMGNGTPISSWAHVMLMMTTSPRLQESSGGAHEDLMNAGRGTVSASLSTAFRPGLE